jgi:hypothetical protein
MTRYTFGTALRAATLAAAIGALASPAFAQQQTGTGGGAGGESGSSKATDMNKGPVNPTAGSTGGANTGMNQNTGGGASKAGTGGGAAGEGGSGSTSERQTGSPRGDAATPAK